jgi:hypothetical protein
VQAAVLPHVVDAENVRVRDDARERHFATEAFQGVRAIFASGGDHFDGHGARQLAIVGAIDLPHAPSREERVDSVARTE